MAKEKEHLGVNYDGEVPFAYCGKHKWEIIPPTSANLVKMQEETQKYEKMIDKLGDATSNSPAHIKAYESATKAVLEMILKNFKYTKYANDPECGPILLGYLTAEVRVFLLNGGKHGARRLQMLSDTVSGI